MAGLTYPPTALAALKVKAVTASGPLSGFVTSNSSLRLNRRVQEAVGDRDGQKETRKGKDGTST